MGRIHKSFQLSVLDIRCIASKYGHKLLMPRTAIKQPLCIVAIFFCQSMCMTNQHAEGYLLSSCNFCIRNRPAHLLQASFSSVYRPVLLFRGNMSELTASSCIDATTALTFSLKRSNLSRFLSVSYSREQQSRNIWYKHSEHATHHINNKSRSL